MIGIRVISAVTIKIIVKALCVLAGAITQVTLSTTFVARTF